MGTIGIVLAMLAAVVISGAVTRILPFPVPTPLVQIAFGGAIALFSVSPVRLEPDLFFLLFLPPLLFLDGWRIPKEDLLRDKVTILELALGLVFFTVIGMGYFIHWMIPAMPLPIAFALAAIVSPTDPIAVSAITRRVPAPRRFLHVLEGESLLNDASGLVCFRFAVAAALTGSFSLSAATLSFAQLAVGGIVIGVALTAVIMTVTHVVSSRIGEEAGSEVLISVLVPFAAYEAAEHAGGSGILAAVAAGITMSYIELSGKALAITRMQRSAVWNTLQFALNGSVFVLLGEQLPTILSNASATVEQSEHTNPAWLAVYVLAMVVGLAALRFVWVWTSLRLSAFARLARGEAAAQQISARLIAALSVAGARGAITMAGVLTLPLALGNGDLFPTRDLAIALAAGTIIGSLLAASIALPRLLRGIDVPEEPAYQREIDRARVEAAEAAMKAIESLARGSAANPEESELRSQAATRLLDVYRRRIEGSNRDGESAIQIRRADEIERSLRLAGLQAERDRIFQLARSQALSDATARKLVRNIDLLEERLK
ncbi:MAG: Na+/H+ antiporter [Steroidobacteraceae bacterium]